MRDTKLSGELSLHLSPFSFLRTLHLQYGCADNISRILCDDETHPFTFTTIQKYIPLWIIKETWSNYYFLNTNTHYWNAASTSHNSLPDFTGNWSFVILLHHHICSAHECVTQTLHSPGLLLPSLKSITGGQSHPVVLTWSHFLPPFNVFLIYYQNRFSFSFHSMLVTFHASI